MAVSEIKFYAGGEKLFRQYPILTTNYIWVLLKASYVPSQAHSIYNDVSANVCDTAGYVHVDATGAAFVNTYDPDFANVAFNVGSEGKYVVLCTKTSGSPDKLVGFYDVEVGGTLDVEFNTAFVINAGGVLDYNIEGWTYGGGGGGGGGGNEPPPSGAVTEVVVTQFARTGTPSSYPLNFTVPYAKGILATNSTFALYDANNVKKRAQFDAFERWEDTSIKMLHVCCDTSYDAEKTFKVKSGDTQSFPAAATVVTAGNLVTVSFNGNDYVTNNSAFTFMNGFQIYALNALDSLEYLSANATTTVVENGEVRAVLRSEGEIKNGSTILFHFILRQYFYPLSGAVEIECTFESRQAEGTYTSNSGSSAGYSRAIKISCSEIGIKNSASYNGLWAQGDVTDHSATSTSEMFIKQNGTYVKLGTIQQPYVFSYSGVGSGTKASGAFQVTKTAGERRGVLYKDFWKQYPSAISASQTGLKIKFHYTDGQADTQWPSMANSSEYRWPNTFFSPGYGIAKTYKVLLLTSEKTDAELKKINDIYQQYLPQALPTRDYIRSTKVFGDYNLTTNAAAAYDARKENNMNVSFWNHLDGTTTAKLQVRYGWRFFGNRAHSDSEQQVVTTLHPSTTARCTGYYNGGHFGTDKMLLHYLRTGNEKFWYFSAIETQNFSDLLVCHAPRKGYWQVAGANTDIEFSGGECMAMFHDNLDCYVRNYTGSHFNVSSLGTFWLFEKNYRYKEVLEKMSSWLSTLVDNWYPKVSYAGFGQIGIPEQRPFTEQEREVGNNLMNACKIMHYLNKATYWDDCVVKIINYLLLWIKREAPHYSKSVQIGTHSWSSGDAYWWMDWGSNAQGHSPLHTGCNPWMAGIILGGLAQARDLSIRFNKTLPADFYDMVSKAITYIVQWGRHTDGRWLYIEGYPPPPNSSAGIDKSHNLAYGLGYWGNYFNNSGWYNLGLAIHTGTLNMTGQNSASFYGYEEVLWPEEFKIFNT